MELERVVRGRYSCRTYHDRPVDDSLIKGMVDLARNAPSASNRQEWRFVVVKDKHVIRAIADNAGDQKWWAGAPVIIACCAETDNHLMRCGQACYPVDLAIIIDHLCLIAADQGLGTCWLGAFDEDAVRTLCRIPHHVRVVSLLTLGYPADSPKPKTRLPLEQILFRDRWEQGMGQ